MTRAATLLTALPIAAVLALACSASEPPAPTKVAAAEPDASAAVGGAVVDQAAAAPDGVPKIESDAAVYEFGAINATDSIEHVFKIRNTGTADLKIERVQKT